METVVTHGGFGFENDTPRSIRDFAIAKAGSEATQLAEYLANGERRNKNIGELPEVDFVDSDENPANEDG